MDSESGFPAPGPGLGHEYYAGLCALATSGSLSHEERADLNSHLAECPGCQELLQEYRTLATHTMSALAVDHPLSPDDLPQGWSAERSKQRLLARIAIDTASRKPQLVPDRPTQAAAQTWKKLFQPPAFRKLRFAGGLVLLLLVLALTYRLGENRGLRQAASGSPKSPVSQPENPSPNIAVSASHQSMDDQRELRRLQDELRRQVAALADFKSLHQQLEQESQRQTAVIAALNSEKSFTATERDAANRRLQEMQDALQATQQRLDTLREENGRQLLRTASLQQRVDELNSRLKESDASLQREENFLASDRDVRELMGARDLYIADVFDIDRDGKTQKAFGRVFYTGGKSLIFYAFDLDRQPNAREPRTYQAWGRRGPADKRPLSMGVLSLENATNQRWVMRFDDPKLLSQIDAVFVTAEPHAGGQKPTGRQLLFASLRTPPNHP